MFAVGCLLLVVLPLIGLVAGLAVGGTKLAMGLAIGGFLLAAAICGVASYALVKASRAD